ncbi:MAG: prolyl oligopeptidase family serine peptidase [bacterium]
MKKLSVMFFAIFLIGCIASNVVYASDIGKAINAQPVGQYSREKMDKTLSKTVFGVDPASYGFEYTKYPVSLYKVRYRTANPYRRDAVETVSGLLAVPMGAQGSLPVLSYQHSAEFSKHEIPSNPDGCLEAQAVIAAFAGHGYVIFMPDYIGKGDSMGRHTFIMADGEAQASWDMLKAGKKICSEMDIKLSSDLFLSGWSQGGHATMAFLRLLRTQRYPGVRAAAPVAGPYDMYLNWAQWLIHTLSPKIPAIMAYVILAYGEYYNLPGLSQEALKPRYQDVGQKIFDTDVIPKDVFEQFGRTPRELFQETFVTDSLVGTDAFCRALYDNEVYMWQSDVPIRFYYGEADDMVPPVIAQTAYGYMKNMGSDVSLVNAGKSAGHAETFLFALLDARKWFDGLRSKVK